MSGASPSRSNPSDRRGSRLEDLRSTWDHNNITILNALVFYCYLRQGCYGIVVGLDSLLADIAHNI
jgi:hypothetical protein